MTGVYSLSDLADQDILDIGVYLAQFGVRTADRLIDRLHKCFERLAEFPTMGRARDEIRPGLRSFAVQNYIVYYLLVEGGIRVIRVLHDSRDVENELS